QHIWVQHKMRFAYPIWSEAPLFQLRRQVFAHHPDKTLTPFAAHRPEGLITDGGDFLRQVLRYAVPAFRSAGVGPDTIGLRRVPGWHVHAIGDVADRNFASGPAREQRLKNTTAEFAVQAADAETRRRTALRQPRHVERLLCIRRIGAAKVDKTLERC